MYILIFLVIYFLHYNFLLGGSCGIQELISICLLVALGAVAVPSTSQKVLVGDCSQHGLLWDCGANRLVWTKGAVRMNHMQVVGSHNSYHVEAPKAERDLQTAWTSAATDLQYSHAALDVQLEYLHVRNLE